jgi:ketosteroid isomerase-like protein
MRTVALSATVLTLLGCNPAPAPDTSAAAKQAIDVINAGWARLSAAGHSDSIADYYHPNGVLLPPNMPTVRGRDSIRAFFAVLNTMSSPPPTLSIRAEEVWASGPSATELGRWTFTWPAGAPLPPGAMAVDSGKYMARWVEENGQWLMVQDIWNSDLTPPPPPAAAQP